MESFKDNRSLSILSAAEKFKQKFSIIYKYQQAFDQKITPVGDEHGRDDEFLKQGMYKKLIYYRYTVK